MDGVVGEAIRRGFLEIEPGVAAEDIKEVALAGGDVQHQAAAAVRQLGRGHAARGVGLDVADVQLGSYHAAEEVAEPGAAAELVVETEGAVVPGVGPEGTEFELTGVLGGQGAGPRAGEQREKGGRECAHQPRAPRRASDLR